MRADVVVVGAGVAGLVAAARVADAGRSVVVLEARERVGGRTETVDGVDVGATWIGAGHRRARALIDSLALELVPTFTDGHAVVADGGRVWSDRDYRLRHVPQELALRLAWRRFDRLARRDGDPWERPDAARLDAVTLDGWLRRAVPLSGARSVIRGTMANILGADAEQVSLLHALHYVGANGGVHAVLATEGGAQQDMVADGMQSIADRLAQRLGESVVLGAPVGSIRHGEGSVHVDAGAVSVEAHAAVVALPPALVPRIGFSPGLPGGRDQLAQRMPMGDVIKVVCVYDEPFWRADGLTADTWGRDLPYSFSHDVGDAIAVFFVGADARAARALPASERAGAVTRGLARCLGERAGRPTAVLERDWAAEQWTRGAYAGYMTPGGWTTFGPLLRGPVGALSFAGSETAADGIGYVEGAIASGERAAAEALDRL